MMFKHLLILLIVTCNSVTVFSQNHNFYMEYHLGFAPSHYDNFKSIFDDRNSFQLNSDQGMALGYEYKILKKYNTFLYVNYETSKTEYTYVPFEGFYMNGEEFSLNVSNRRNAVQYGIRKKFSFWDDKFQVAVGVGFSKRFYTEDMQRLSGALQEHTDLYSKYFEYRLTTFHDGHYHLDGFFPNNFFANIDNDLVLTYKLNDILSIRLSMMLSRNHYVFYVFNTKYSKHEVGQVVFTGSNNSGYVGPLSSTYYTQNHILQTKIGLELKLDALKR